MRKLSEIKGEEALDVIADIVEPIANIALDEDAAEMFTKKPCPKGMTPAQFTIQRLQKSVPSLVKGHKGDLIKILSIVDGITAQEYTENMSLASLVSDCISLTNDPELMALFP